MKRIISILLSLTLIVSLVPLSALATTGEEETKLTKQEMLQNLLEKYDEDGILEDGVEYTWDCNEIDEISSSTETGITPRWGTGSSEKVGTHNYIIELANSAAKETDGASFIPEIYIPLVEKASTTCDKGYTGTFKNVEVQINKVGAIQGSENYVATLKYLWQFTKCFNKYKDEETITNNKLIKYIEEANTAGTNGIPSSITGKNYFQNMTNFVYNMLTVCYKDTNFAWNDNHILGKRCKFIMFGIIAHLIGDVYAHRTIVPKMCAKTIIDETEAEDYNATVVNYDETSETHTAKYFNPGDFNDFTRLTELKRSIFKENIHSENKACFGELRTYYYSTDAEANEAHKLSKLSNEEIAELTIEEQEIAREGKLLIQTMNGNYIDEGAFYTERVEEAVLALEWFFSFYSDGFDVFTIDPVCVNIKQFQKYIDALKIDYTYEPV